MSVKIGDMTMEWVILHCRNGEVFIGVTEVTSRIDEEKTRCYFDDMANLIMQSKTRDFSSDRIIELRNPHQIITGAGPNGMTVAPMPLTLGNKIIFLRSGEILFVQFMDSASPLVRKIMQDITGIVVPEPAGESRSGGGIILPGSSAPKA